MGTKNNLMYVAFRKGYVDSNLFEKLVAWWTGLLAGTWGKLDYCHVELIFPDGMSFSSDPNDGGVRFKDIKYSHPDRWDIFELNIDESRFDSLYQVARKLIGRAYDWLGCIFDAGLHVKVLNDLSKLWCNEACMSVLYVLSYLKIKPKDITGDPIRMYQFCKRKRLLMYKVTSPF